jgi:VIT1/CCC1 family predicted Fe2+/Mn2+ transporter
VTLPTGLAELFSGAISMGLGAYLACITERDHYIAEEARELEETFSRPEDEKEEIYQILAEYAIERECARPMVESLARNRDQWVKVGKRFA